MLFFFSYIYFGEDLGKSPKLTRKKKKKKRKETIPPQSLKLRLLSVRFQSLNWLGHQKGQQWQCLRKEMTMERPWSPSSIEPLKLRSVLSFTHFIFFYSLKFHLLLHMLTFIVILIPPLFIPLREFWGSSFNTQ